MFWSSPASIGLPDTSYTHFIWWRSVELDHAPARSSNREFSTTQQEGQLREGAQDRGMLVELRVCRALGKRCGREDNCVRSLDKKVEELAAKVHSTASLLASEIAHGPPQSRNGN